jgi:zinc transporter, ZIP family
MFNDQVMLAFSLTLLAGLGTGVGSALAFFPRRTNTRFLSVSLGFSAGVMIYVSFVEILSKARLDLSAAMGDRAGAWTAVLAFFAGIAATAIIDRLVPSYENPHETHRVEEMDQTGEERRRRELMRMGVLSAVAIAIHNFPEGLATFAAAMNDTHVGISIAIAIGLHNIPEGIAISVPVYYATNDRRKAFLYSFASGLCEPVGAVFGYFLLMRFVGDIVRGFVFALVAGIMVFISLDELLPTAREYGEHHLAAYGLVGGMGVMALTLLLLMP